MRDSIGSSVGPTDDEHLSRITLTVDGALHPIDQVTKQLHKLVNVLKIRDLEPADTVARELALFKVSADGVQRAEVLQICEIFRGNVVDVRVTKEENVYPMIAPGAAARDMVG